MKKVFVICMSFVCLVLPGLATAGSLTNNGNGTVTDSGTNLTWQQGESGAMTWEAALTYCEGLNLAGNTDWRLPNHKELLSLVDYAKATVPTINTTLFPGVISPLYQYWSSTTVASDTSVALGVDFEGGSSVWSDKTNPGYARCVRGGQ